MQISKAVSEQTGQFLFVNYYLERSFLHVKECRIYNKTCEADYNGNFVKYRMSDCPFLPQ